MTGTLIGFGIWCVTGCFFIGLGIHAFRSKEAVILFSVIGVMAEVVIAMVIYVTVIEKRYKNDRIIKNRCSIAKVLLNIW